jgi:hypothetical protein
MRLPFCVPNLFWHSLQNLVFSLRLMLGTNYSENMLLFCHRYVQCHTYKETEYMFTVGSEFRKETLWNVAPYIKEQLHKLLIHYYSMSHALILLHDATLLTLIKIRRWQQSGIWSHVCIGCKNRTNSLAYLFTLLTFSFVISFLPFFSNTRIDIRLLTDWYHIRKFYNANKNSCHQ